MRFTYSTIAPARHESDSLPWLPLVLRVGTRAVKAVGLVDSGATVNVLPFELGVELGAVWDERDEPLDERDVEVEIRGHFFGTLALIKTLLGCCSTRR
jgi:hypothetical protein